MKTRIILLIVLLWTGLLSAQQPMNNAQVGGNATSTAASGVQKVGVVGNSGAAVDSTVGAGAAPANQVVGGTVYNSTAPAPTTGQAMALQSDQAGNLRTSPGVVFVTLSAQGTALNSTQTIFTNSGTMAVAVQLTQTTTLTAGAITFEDSWDNGTTWNSLPIQSVLDPTSGSGSQLALPYTLQASTNKLFLLKMRGGTQLRIRTSTAITGTGSVTPSYALLAFQPLQSTIAFEPNSGGLFIVNSWLFSHGGNSMDGTVGAGSAPASMLVVGHVFNSTVPAPTTGQSVSLQADSTGGSYVNTEGRRASYRISADNLTPIANVGATMCGSATKTIHISRATFSMLNTAASSTTQSIIATKRSTADSGGTCTAGTAVPLDSNNAATSATFLNVACSVVPSTLGTSVGVVGARRSSFGILAGSLPNLNWEFTFGNVGSEQELTLRGTAQCVDFTFGSATGSYDLDLEWTEE